MTNYLPDYRSFVSGVIASWCSVIVGQPLDIIKVRMQNTGGTTLSTVKSLMKNEGIFAFWKASFAPIVGSGLSSAVSLGTNENSKRIIRYYNQSDEKLSVLQHGLCGAIAGFIRSFIACPTEHVTIKLQMQGKIDTRGDPLYKGVIDCFNWIRKNHGIKGLYKGISWATPRDCIGNGIFWGSYQFIGKKYFGNDKIDTHELETWKIMLCGGSAGIVFWSCIFWIDLIKTKLQSDSLTNPRYKSNYDCLYQTLKESGIRGLYRGIVPALLRAFPVSAAYVAGFESAMSFLGRDQK